LRLLPSIARRTIFLCLALTASSALVAQTSPQSREEVAFLPATFEEQFSNFVASPASDPADSVCQKQAAGANVVSPPDLFSSNGVLTVNFNFNTAVDQQGLTRYCYIYASSDGKTFYLAPTLRVNPGDQLVINLTNTISASAAASAMPGMVMKPDAAAASSDCNATSVSSTSTNLHFHGLNVSPACHQDEVIHTIIQPQQTFTYTVQIPSNEPSGMYWYHPHPHGFSQGQVLGGATGAIIVEGIQNFNSIVAGLPERVMVIRDQALTSAEQSIAGNQPGDDLSLNYVPVTYPNYVPASLSTPVSTKEFWRVANTAANSLIDLQILDNNVAQTLQIVAVDGVPLTDSSGNPTTTSVTNFVLPPGARVEFIYTTPKQGDTAQVITANWNNGPDGDADPMRPLANILASTTNSDSGLPVANAAPVSKIPTVTEALPPLRFKALNGNAATAATVQRTLYFSIKPDFSQFYITVAGQTPTAFNMDAPPSIVVHAGTVEQWTIQNQSEMDHAFHIHQIHFRTLAINGSPVTDYTERDTIDVPHWSGNASDPYPSVTLLMDFSDPDIVGTFVYHCHILSHEDLGMMAAIQVLPPLVDSTTKLTASASAIAPGATETFTATVTGGSGTPTGSVTFSNGSTSLGSATLNSSGVATFSTTSLPAGTNSITAVYGGDSTYSGSTSSAVTVTVGTAPSISGVNANYGAPGATITITGTNFGASQASSTVTFSGIKATISSWTSTKIAALVPSTVTTGTTGSLIVTVGGIASNAISFTYYPALTITSISPASGAVGNLVVINGTNLQDAQGNGSVSFYNGVMTPILIQSPTNIQVDVPAGAMTGPIHVHTNGIGYNSATFTVVAANSAPQITNVNADYGARGATITITGTRFGSSQGSSTVTFSGITSTPSSWSATKIVVLVPSTAPTSGSGSLIVTVGGSASNSVPFTYYPALTITSISPTSGSVGTTVTINGTNLEDAHGKGSVSFYNGVMTPIIAQSSTSMTVKVPTGATTGPIHPHTNGIGANSATFTVQ
jgi:FtsP/CotA-like multicopper oxidase with cupredoxin domain